MFWGCYWFDSRIWGVFFIARTKCHQNCIPTILVAHFGFTKALGVFWKLVGPPLDPILLVQPLGIWKSQFKVRIKLPCCLHMIATHIQKLLEKLASSAIPSQHLFEWYFKFVKLCRVIVLGNMEDKWTFSNLSFIKTSFGIT